MEVFSFGNGDFLFQIFTAIKGVMADNSFGTLIRISIIFGFLIVLYQLFFSMNITTVSLGILKHYIIVAIVYYVLFVPKTDVIIRDEVKNTNVSVANLPLGVGFFAHAFTSVEKGITNMLETYFTTPNDMKFSKSGYAFSVMVIDSMKNATPVDPYFKRTLNDYVVNCFFHDILWGDKDLNAIIYSNTLFSDMSPSHSINIFTKIYNSSFPQGEAKTCQEAYSNLQTNIGTAASNSLEKLNQTMQIDVTSKLPVVVQSFLNVSQNATDLLGQSFVANAMKTGLAETAMYTGVSADAIAYASAMAEQQQRSSWTVAGELAKKYIPIMRQILEAFVYGLFPLLFILMLSPIGTTVLRMYFTLLVWLLLWSPLFAIINLIVNVRATGVLSASFGYYSIGTMPYIYESTSDITAMAGYLAWMVPTLAFAIAKGSDYAMVSIASGIQGSTNLTTVHAGQGISNVEGSVKAAQTAGHFQAAQYYSSRGIADAVAANYFYNMAYGNALGEAGNYVVDRLARNELKNRIFEGNVNSQKIDDLKNSFGPLYEAVVAAGRTYNESLNAGKSWSYKNAQEVANTYKISEDIFKGAQKGFNEIAQSFNMSPQQLSYSIAQLDTGQKAEFIQRFTDKYNMSFDNSAKSLAALTGDKNFADIHTFKGKVEAAGGVDNVAATYERSGKIDQETLQATLNELDKYGLTEREYGGAQAKLNAASIIAASNMIRRGELSDDMLVAMKEANLFTDIARGESAVALARLYANSQGRNMLPPDIKEAAKFLQTREYASNFAKYQELQSFADKYFKGNSPMESILNAESWSNRLNLGGLEGTYNAMRSSGFTDPQQFAAFNAEIRGMREFSDNKAYDDAMKGLAEKYGITPSQAYKAAADFRYSQDRAVLDYYSMDAQKYYETTQGMTNLQQSEFVNTLREMKAAGISPEQIGGWKGIKDAVQAVSEFRQFNNGNITKDDYALLAATGILQSAGRAHAVEKIAQTIAKAEEREYTQEDIKTVSDFLNTREGLQAYAKMFEAQQFSGKSSDLSNVYNMFRAMNRNANISLGQDEAKKYDLPEGFSQVAWSDKGNVIYSNTQSGRETRTVDKDTIESGRFERFVADRKGAQEMIKIAEGNGLKNIADGIRSILKAHPNQKAFTFNVEKTTDGAISSISGNAGGEISYKDHSTSIKGFRNAIEAIKTSETGSHSKQYNNFKEVMSGNYGQHFNVNQGNVVIGNTKEDRAFVAAFNAAIDKQVTDFKKANPQLELDPKYIESLKLRVGDHLIWNSGGSGSQPSSFSIDRGGNRVIQYVGKTQYGSDADIKQGQTRYSAGTKADGVATGMLGEFARKVGASEETAKKIESYGAVLVGISKEITPMVGIIKAIPKKPKVEEPFRPQGDYSRWPREHRPIDEGK